MAELMFIGGLLLGFILLKVFSSHKTQGDLRIDESDPDGPYLFLELHQDLNDIRKKKNIRLNVKTISFIPNDTRK